MNLNSVDLLRRPRNPFPAHAAPDSADPSSSVPRDHIAIALEELPPRSLLHQVLLSGSAPAEKKTSTTSAADTSVPVPRLPPPAPIVANGVGVGTRRGSASPEGAIASRVAYNSMPAAEEPVCWLVHTAVYSNFIGLIVCSTLMLVHSSIIRHSSFHIPISTVLLPLLQRFSVSLSNFLHFFCRLPIRVPIISIQLEYTVQYWSAALRLFALHFLLYAMRLKRRVLYFENGAFFTISFHLCMTCWVIDYFIINCIINYEFIFCKFYLKY